MKGGDVEAGVAPPLYPGMMEKPELRWAFIRKIYSILTVQILLTVAVCAVVVAVHPIADYLVTTTPSTFSAPHVLLSAKAPSFLAGLTCAVTSDRVILEAASVTAALVVSLTLYTFWAARRRHDFKFLGPFLFCSLVALICFGIIQILFPFGKITNMIYGILGTIIFSGYIIYDTDNLIKRYSYDDYIWASVSLHLDVISLFLSLLCLFKA